jgi:hypothetical protein
MNNEPVAWMSADGKFNKKETWLFPIPLYTQPVKEQYKFGVDWSKDGNAVTVLKICEDGVAEVVFMDYQETTHPVKELTDEEINKLWAESHEDGIAMQQGFTTQQHYFAHLILRKAQEK